MLENNKEDPHLDSDLRTYEEAMLDIDSDKWQEGLDIDSESIYTNKVWTLVEPPKGVVPISSKWSTSESLK